jgi:hypothetical protein
MERLLGVLTIVVLVVVLSDWNHLFARPTTESAACIGRNTAWTMAKVIVRQNLGGPLVTGFPNREAASDLDGMSFDYLGDCRYKISAFVDAYYRYSGLKRRYFVVELSYHGRSGWRMDQLDFTEPPRT